MRYSKDEEIKRLRDNFSDYTKVVLHDLSAPVRIMQGYTDILEQDLRGRLSDKEVGYIESMKKAKDQFTVLIEALNDYSNLISSYKYSEVPFDTGEVIDSAISKFSKKLEAAEIKITKQGNFPSVKGDSKHFHMAFWELIDNAIKFMGEQKNPHIQISAAEIDDEYEFIVKDNGIGMHERSFKSIFLVLRKLHSDQEYSGQGMGLANVKTIVENHGGRVLASSKEGAGCNLCVYLPK